jgi:hypothetical protein
VESKPLNHVARLRLPDYGDLSGIDYLCEALAPEAQRIARKTDRVSPQDQWPLTITADSRLLDVLSPPAKVSWRTSTRGGIGRGVDLCEGALG